MPDRLSLALPIDVAHMFDVTVSSDQISVDTFPGGGVKDGYDSLASMLEDAEHEFRQATDQKFSVSRVGVAGQRQTYENVTYDLNGHQSYKENWTGTTANYLPQEVKTSVKNGRILPFDPDTGDELYIYRGLGGKSAINSDTWEDITDEFNESWTITNYSSGTIVFDPTLLFETRLSNQQGVSIGGRNQLQQLEVAISYRYGGLGGSSDYATATDLSSTLSQGQTGTISVADGSRFPSDGTKVLKIEREYVLADLNPSADSMDILERGIRGTTDAEHASGGTVQYTPPSVRKAVAARAAEQLVTSGRYQDWLPGTEDDFDKGDMVDQFSETWEATVAALSA